MNNKERELLTRAITAAFRVLEGQGLHWLFQDVVKWFFENITILNYEYGEDAGLFSDIDQFHRPGKSKEEFILETIRRHRRARKNFDASFDAIRRRVSRYQNAIESTTAQHEEEFLCLIWDILRHVRRPQSVAPPPPFDQLPADPQEETDDWWYV